MSELDQIKMFVEMWLNVFDIKNCDSYEKGIKCALKAVLDKIEQIEQQSAVSDCANFDALCRIRDVLSREFVWTNAEKQIQSICDARIEAETKAVKR